VIFYNPSIAFMIDIETDHRLITSHAIDVYGQGSLASLPETNQIYGRSAGNETRFEHKIFLPIEVLLLQTVDQTPQLISNWE
jgi:hypothetical protein